jgi:lipid-binding SYLF domain-containing protein
MQAAFAAAGMTAYRGEGFVVALHGGQWSAPAFIRLSSIGMGFALGGEQLLLLCGYPTAGHADILTQSMLHALTGEMVDTIAILHKEDDVDKYKKGDFGWHAYMTGSPLEVEHSMSAEAAPAVFTAKSGTLLNFSLNGAGQHCHGYQLL